MGHPGIFVLTPNFNPPHILDQVYVAFNPLLRWRQAASYAFPDCRMKLAQRRSGELLWPQRQSPSQRRFVRA
jgi:hypothetical protein